MVYKWRTFDLSVPAQVAGEHIEELDKQHGKVTPQILLDDARPDGAVLHPLYEWNDEIASEKYRLWQSKKIMSELVVVRAKQKQQEEAAPVRAFVSVNKVKEPARYIPVVKALSDEDTRRVIIDNALAELDAYERKYRGIIDYVSLVQTWLDGKQEATS